MIYTVSLFYPKLKPVKKREKNAPKKIGGSRFR